MKMTIKLAMFAVYDRKAESYNPPYFMTNENVAIRQFTEMANDPKNMVCKHPEDFLLFFLGYFDTITCKFELFDISKEICNGLSVHRQEVNNA
jgi:hypothetical protein